MKHELIFRVEAEKDLIDIQDYYNKILRSITDNFFIEFFETMDFIEDEPKLFQVRYRRNCTFISFSIWDSLQRNKKQNNNL